METIPVAKFESAIMVAFDLETTSFSNSENGISKKNDILFMRSKQVESTDNLTALEEFSAWIDSIENIVILGGHNVDRLGSKHQWRIIHSYGLSNDYSSVIEFIDPPPLLRCLQPHEKTHKQEAVDERVLEANATLKSLLPLIFGRNWWVYNR